LHKRIHTRVDIFKDLRTSKIFEVINISKVIPNDENELISFMENAYIITIEMFKPRFQRELTM